MQRITEEYYLQGDDMVKRGMVVPEMMNRHSATPRQETTRSFIKFIASPFFETCLAPWLPADVASMLLSNVRVVTLCGVGVRACVFARVRVCLTCALCVTHRWRRTSLCCALPRQQ
jgi:hypothetical protein